MRILLDTNILIHREAAIVVMENIGVLFNWLDRLGHEKCVHPASVAEIKKHQDERIRRSFLTKLASYQLIQHPAPLHPQVQALGHELDRTENGRIDTVIINELFCDRVDYLISEDRGVARKAERLGIADRLFTVDAFLEKATAENPGFADYKVLAVKKEHFGDVNLPDPFFDSFRRDYPGFDKWFNRKAEEPAYICRDNDTIVAFLYLKLEGEREPYPDIAPAFRPKRRLKIGTMKVELNGYKIGERFLKIVFDNAIRQHVDEVYVTIFERTLEQQRLVGLLRDFGFVQAGVKRNPFGDELVLARDLTPAFNAQDPKLTFPFVSGSGRTFIVPIYPEYHTELLPDSILKTESPKDFVEHSPHRNAIRKVYISRSIFRALQPGDTVIFYRTGGYYQGVATSIGVVDKVIRNIANEEQFIRLCRKRSVFTDDELRKHWNYNPRNRPFIVEFLYAYAFPKRPNLASLIENHVIRDVNSVPRGFERITADQLSAVLSLSQTDPGIIVH